MITIQILCAIYTIIGCIVHYVKYKTLNLMSIPAQGWTVLLALTGFIIFLDACYLILKYLP